LFNTCPWMVYLDFSGVLVKIRRSLHLSGWSCINHSSSHFCNVSRSCCRMCRSSSDLILQYRLIIYGCTSRSRIFHLYGNFTIAGEGLQNLGLEPLSREEPLSCHTCCDIGPQFFWFHPKDCPIKSPLTTCKGMLRTYSDSDPYGVRYRRQSSANSLGGRFHCFRS
jgi:hypothetical protein